MLKWILILWFISLGLVVYSDYFRNSVETSTVESSTNISKLNNFDNIYEIYLKKPFGNRQSIGYKHEILQKIDYGYKYSIIMKLGSSDFGLGINFFDIKGEMNFDDIGDISDFKVLVQNNFLITGEKIDSAKIMVRIGNISDVQDGNIQSKVYEIDDFKFDFLFTRLLPFSNYDIGKLYNIEYIVPSVLSKSSGIDKTSIQLKKISDKEYTISQKLMNVPLETTLKFDENNEIVSESNSIMSVSIVKNKNQQTKLLNKFDDNNELSQENYAIADESSGDIYTGNKNVSGNNELTGLNISNIIDSITSNSDVKSCSLLN